MDKLSAPGPATQLATNTRTKDNQDALSIYGLDTLGLDPNVVEDGAIDEPMTQQPIGAGPTNRRKQLCQLATAPRSDMDARLTCGIHRRLAPSGQFQLSFSTAFIVCVSYGR
jgi:hypothetical protein